MKRIDGTTSREALAALVSEALRDAGLDAVLVGGSVVSLYTKELFPSDDLDFASWKTMKEARPALEKLGFTRFEGNRAEHPEAHYYVQLVRAPVQIGDRIVQKPAERKTERGRILLLSPPSARAAARRASGASQATLGGSDDSDQTNPCASGRDPARGVPRAARDVAHLGIPAQRVNKLVNGRRGITPEMAWMLGRAFGVGPEFWMNLQTAYDLATARKKAEKVKPIKRPG